MVKVAPSLLSANFACLKDDIEKIENGKADWLHYDVMDGHFVPNISFGYSILKDVSKVTNLFLDVHLMISEPQKYVDEFIKSGANLIVFHIFDEFWNCGSNGKQRRYFSTYSSY